MSRMTREIAGLGLLALLSVTCLSGCYYRQRMETRQGWESILLIDEGSVLRTPYCGVLNVEGFVGFDGYLLWRGSYRGLRLELYSCVSTAPIVLVWREVKYVSLVLTAWGDKLPDGVILAERRYRAGMIDMNKLEGHPNYTRVVAAGRLRVEVEDRGGGRLAVRLNALKTPKWREFDLDPLISDAGFAVSQGPCDIKWPRPPDWDRDRFVAVMRERMKLFDTSRDYLTRAEIRQLDHPRWRDAEAVSELLRSRSPEILLHTLRLMVLMNRADPRYMISLWDTGDDLLKMGTHSDKRIRSVFTKLLLCSHERPANLKNIAPLLYSNDPSVRGAVLNAYRMRDELPADTERLEQLAIGWNAYVTSIALDLLEKSQAGRSKKQPPVFPAGKVRAVVLRLQRAMERREYTKAIEVIAPNGTAVCNGCIPRLLRFLPCFSTVCLAGSVCRTK